LLHPQWQSHLLEFLSSGGKGSKTHWESFLRNTKGVKLKSCKKAGEAQHVAMQLWDDVSG
jgi:hypothetical protein